MLALCLFAVGHLVRDGWPALHTTHGARALGALICGLGAWNPWIGIAILIGFYVDQKHGEGQQARDWKDALYLMLSGVTSLLPLAIYFGFFVSPWFALIALLGVIKVPIWFAAWRIRPDKWWSWLEPTRVSAIIFGAAIGTAIGVLYGY